MTNEKPYVNEKIILVFSQFSIVLEKTHLVNPNDTEATPSREDIQTSHVFNLQDVISIELQNVDMDYAVTDSFTDSSISKRLHSGHSINEKVTLCLLISKKNIQLPP